MTRPLENSFVPTLSRILLAGLLAGPVVTVLALATLADGGGTELVGLLLIGFLAGLVLGVLAAGVTAAAVFALRRSRDRARLAVAAVPPLVAVLPGLLLLALREDSPDLRAWLFLALPPVVVLLVALGARRWALALLPAPS